MLWDNHITCHIILWSWYFTKLIEMVLNEFSVLCILTHTEHNRLVLFTIKSRECVAIQSEILSSTSLSRFDNILNGYFVVLAKINWLRSHVISPVRIPSTVLSMNILCDRPWRLVKSRWVLKARVLDWGQLFVLKEALESVAGSETSLTRSEITWGMRHYFTVYKII